MCSAIVKVALRNQAYRAVGLLVAVILSGCASQVPATIRTAPPAAIDLTQVQLDPGRYQDQLVRWGGSIIRVDNHPDRTEIEVLARPLDADGEPHTREQGQGRFIARVAGFLDPAEYAKERGLTVVGPITGVETRPVGDFPYAYPIVAVESDYLWPKVPPLGANPDYPPGFLPWYGPWYGPYGPYRPYFGPWRRPWYGW